VWDGGTCSTSVGFGAKRTLTEPRSTESGFMSARPSAMHRENACTHSAEAFHRSNVARTIAREKRTRELLTLADDVSLRRSLGRSARHWQSRRIYGAKTSLLAHTTNLFDPRVIAT
jgi:hypothetical protein